MTLLECKTETLTLLHGSYIWPVLFCAIFMFQIANAQRCFAETSIEPIIGLRSTWTDNLFLKKLESVEIKTEPALNAGYRTERAKIDLNTRLTDFRYFDTKSNHLKNGKKIDTNEYNRTTYQADSSFSYQVSERFRATLGGGWGQDYSVDSYWDDSLTEQFLLKRDTYNALASFSYELTDVDSVSLSVNYGLMEYDKRIVNFADYSMTNATLTWQHQMLDGTMALVSQASWQHIKFDSPEVLTDYGFLGSQKTKQDIYQDVYSGMFGIYWAPIEKFTMQAMGGANYTSSSIDTELTTTGIFLGENHSTTTKDYSNTGFTGMFDAAWKEASYSIRLNAKQEFLPSTYGELRKTTSLGISTFIELDKKSNIYSALNFSRSKSDNITSNKIDRDFWRFSLQYLYKFTSDFDARIGYVYQYYDNRAENYTRKANNVYLQLTYALPMHF